MKSLNDVVFPIFSIKENDQIVYVNSITYARRGEKLLILDDTSLEGHTLGERRLRLEPKTREVLAYRYPTWETVVGKKSRGPKQYIDSSGYVFVYTPSRSISVKYYKVLAQVIQEGRGSLIYLETLNAPISIPKVLPENDWYFGVGVLNGEPLVFDISLTRKGNTWRKI